jgi:hypothetical protein
MRLIFTLLIVLLAVPAMAGEEALIAADGGVSFTSGNVPVRGNGPFLVDVATDGSAAITFYWFLPADRDSTVRFDPVGTYGESSFALRSSLPPRSFQFTGLTGPDSCYVDVDTASEVIITW